MPITTEDSCSEDYDHYKEYRDFLIDGELKVSEGLDKAILAISSAALGLTFAFSKSIMGKIDLVEFSWLQFSWLFLGCSLCSVLLSLMLASLIYYLNRRQCDLIMKNRSDIILKLRAKEVYSEPVKFKEAVSLKRVNLFFHFLSPVLLVFGVLAIGIFLNLNLEVKLNEQQSSISTLSSSPPVHRINGSQRSITKE
jgi:hypothetical protein